MFSHSGRTQVLKPLLRAVCCSSTDRDTDIIVPRGMQNRVAIDMIVKHIQRTLQEKSKNHQMELQRLGQEVEDAPLSPDILLLKQTKQVLGMTTIIQNPATEEVDFIFYFDRLSTLLVER
jgi:uridine kinase